MLQSDQVTPDAVTEAIDSLLSDDRYRSAAQHVRAEIAAMPTPRDVADILHHRYG